MSEELEQQRAELHHSIAERLQVAQQAIDRDRQWLEWAISFKIDELHGRSIKISSDPHLDGSRYWLVEWGGRHLSNSGWTDGAPKRYSDRESAYSAYLQWKQQEGQ